MSDIFREIDEELRRDNFEKLWARYGKYILALVLLVVVVAASVAGWREYQLRQRQGDGVRYNAALDLQRAGQNAQAAAAFGALSTQATAGAALLSRFEQAGLLAKTGDTAGAVAIYDKLAKDGGIDAGFRDEAMLLAARYRLDTGDPKAIIAQIAPLTDAGNPWHSLALELTALAQLKSGDKTAARTTYQHLADDLTAPQGMRARATEMVAALAP